MAERVAGVKQRLSDYQPQGSYAAIELTAEELSAAIVAHRTSAKGAGKNLLMPKTKTVETRHKHMGQWRKQSDARRRKP